MSGSSTESLRGSPSEAGTGRRAALRWMLGVASAASAALFGFPVLRYLLPPARLGEERTSEIQRNWIAPGDAMRMLVGGRPAIVINTPDGYRAYSAMCTHLGCVVRWRRGRREFFCPCHGGRFDADGRVIGGPPREPLVPLEIEDRGETLVVHGA